MSGRLTEVGNRAVSILPQRSTNSYRITSTSGTIAAALAAGAQLFQFRWTSASLKANITRVRASFRALTPFTAATLTDFGFDLIKATAISAGGGGTALGAPSVLAPGMSASAVATTRIATTAALTAMTTLDAVPIAQSLGYPQRVNPAAATEEVINQIPILDFQPGLGAGDHPLVLGTNEGFVIANRVVWPAAGTGLLQVEVAWSEVPQFNGV